MEKVSLIAALARHCRVEGESLQSFSQELKRLTPADREWFTARFKVEYAYDITIPVVATK